MVSCELQQSPSDPWFSADPQKSVPQRVICPQGPDSDHPLMRGLLQIRGKPRLRG